MAVPAPSLRRMMWSLFAVLLAAAEVPALAFLR